MKKITILANTLSYGHIEKHILSICMMLENDFEIEIISLFRIHDRPVFPFSNKIKITYLVNHGPSNTLLTNYWKEDNLIQRFIDYLKSLQERKELADLIINKVKKIDSDYIITASGFPSNLVGKYAKKGIIKIGADESFYHTPIDLKNAINWHKNFDYYIVPCKESLKLMKRKLGRAKCVYIPNILDEIPRCHSELTSNELVTIGRLTSDKKMEDLFEVINIVKKTIPDVKLNIIGDGAINEELEKLYKKMELNDNVVMHGFLNLNYMDKVICNSSLFITACPLKLDGLAILESMSQGVPAIIFDGPVGSTEVVSRENLRIKKRDIKAMADEIIRLFNNREELNEIGNEVLEISRKHASSKIKDKWLEILK